MKKTLLKSKLHRISVTQVELDYEGSCAVDKEFLELAGMQEYEKVDVYNVTNGERFSTYLILAEAGSKTLSVNGAAAHKVSVNDIVIICTYGLYDESEAKSIEQLDFDVKKSPDPPKSVENHEKLMSKSEKSEKKF